MNLRRRKLFGFVGYARDGKQEPQSRVVDFAGQENRVIGRDHGCAKLNHEPAVSPDEFMTASINNMQYSDYRSNRAANFRVIRGKSIR
jgi:hypothetical protein